MIIGAYRAVSRPSHTRHKHPFLVFDREERLHIPLTVYAKEAIIATSNKTAKTYLNAILPFFTFLEVDEWQIQSGNRWDEKADQVRRAIQDYLWQKLRCKIRQHRTGFQVVEMTTDSHSTIRIFLSALKLFYRIMINKGYYSHPNPLVDSVSKETLEFLMSLEAEQENPRMPDLAGTEQPRRQRRLSDSYFKLKGTEWVPQIVDDPELPGLILKGGTKLKGWGLREECVTRILFESGGRISEITALTLEDWYARGLKQEANSINKGSYGRKVKFLRWNNDTAKLLRRYFDTERAKYDVNGYSLDDYLKLAKRKQVDLKEIPLFLTQRGSTLTPKTFREHYWNPVCKIVGVDVDVHQARHWYVTIAIRTIHETSQTDGEVQRRLRELIEYMKWKCGWEMIEVYQHYFDVQRHAEIQDKVHALMEQSMKQAMMKLEQKHYSKASPSKELSKITTEASSACDFDFLMSMGGERSDH